MGKQETVVVLMDVLLSSPDVLYKGVEGSPRVSVILAEIEELEETLRKARNKKYFSAETATMKALQRHAGKYDVLDYSDAYNVGLHLGDEGLVFITNSISQKHMLTIEGFQCRTHTVKAIEYSGITYIDLPFSSSKRELDRLLSGGLFDVTEFENSFVIIRNTEEVEYSVDGRVFPKPVMIFRYSGGEFTSIDLSKPVLQSSMLGRVRPRNAEQACLFDLLADKDVTIISVGGTYGTGKSFLMSAHAVADLEDEGKRIIYVPNNSEHEYSRELGTLPGNLLEKELPYMGTLIDILSLEGVYQYINSGMIEVVPMAVMRGRNFENATIFVNEAQNLTKKQVQLLIGRVGEGSRIFFDGDFKQADADIFRDNNGLQSLSQLRYSDIYGKLYGAIKLERVERSKTANAASYLGNNF